MDPKYIVIDDGMNPVEMIIFPSWKNHKDVFMALNEYNNYELSSAGFIARKNSYSDGMYCYGRSTTLDKDSNPEVDNNLLSSMFTNLF
jgi:hypothetical protein